MKAFFQQLVYGALALIAVFSLLMTLQGGPVIGVFICGAILAGFYLLRRREQAALRTTVEEIDNQDRPLVLYLRSFGAEEGSRKVRSRMRESFCGTFIRGVSNPIRDQEQEKLATIFDKVGLYVAIGRPGEPLPYPGAKKVYVGDDEWQDVISRWLDRSLAVVLEPGGGGRGLSWEIGRIVRKVSPEKVLILLPRIHADYQSMRKALEGAFPRPLPEEVGKETRLMTFERDWQPKPIGDLLLFFRQNELGDPQY